MDVLLEKPLFERILFGLFTFLMASDSVTVLKHASDVCVTVNSVVVSHLIDLMTLINIKYGNVTATDIIIIIIIIIVSSAAVKCS